MTFKDVIAEDIQQVFLNPEEFGEPHIIDGKEMTVIIDNSEIIERSKKQVDRTDGVYKKQILFYVARSKFGRLPAIGSALRFDGTDYLVVDAVSEGGIYSITIGRTKS